MKNTILSTVCLMVLFLGKTHKGTKHDFNPDSYREFKEDCPKDKWFRVAVFEPISPDSYRDWVDLGYLGIKKWCSQLQSLYIPYKKPRATEANPTPVPIAIGISEGQKIHNTFVSSTRVRGEHAIGHIKNAKIVSHKFRGRKENWDDDVMLAATALHNFKLIF